MTNGYEGRWNILGVFLVVGFESSCGYTFIFRPPVALVPFFGYRTSTDSIDGLMSNGRKRKGKGGAPYAVPDFVIIRGYNFPGYSIRSRVKRAEPLNRTPVMTGGGNKATDLVQRGATIGTEALNGCN